MSRYGRDSHLEKQEVRSRGGHVRGVSVVYSYIEGAETGACSSETSRIH